MRFLLAVGAMLVLGWLVWSSGSLPPSGGFELEVRAGAKTLDPTPSRAMPVDTGPLRFAAAGAREETEQLLEVRVLDPTSRHPLPGVELRAWIHGPQHGNRVLDLAIDRHGRATLPVAALLEASRLDFEIRDPELGELAAFRPPRSLAELVASREPIVVLVPRGAWRTFQVVGPDQMPVAGATLEDHQLRATRTDAAGLGRVRMTVPPPRTVTVWAPGHRVETVPVPPDSEPWLIVLRRASRLEFVMTPPRDPPGYHVELRLPAGMQQRTFFQTTYVQTPGKPVEGTPGRWSQDPHGGHSRWGPSRWSLGFNDTGLAALDHLYDMGTIDATLFYFGEPIETRALVLTPQGGTLRTEFPVAAAAQPLVGTVLDGSGQPLSGVLARMAPFGGPVTIDQGGLEGFPPWAPQTESDGDGRFRLPCPPDDGTVLVFSRSSFAHQVLTVAELEAGGRRVALERGRTVVVEVRGRDGQVLDAGWENGSSATHLHVRPRVQLGHDVWRDVSPGGRGQARPSIPFFQFDDLPSGIVTFGFSYLPDDERLRHDTRLSTAKFQTDACLEELMIGK